MAFTCGMINVESAIANNFTFLRLVGRSTYQSHRCHGGEICSLIPSLVAVDQGILHNKKGAFLNDAAPVV